MRLDITNVAIKNKKIDSDNEAENAINEEHSIEELASEYVDNYQLELEKKQEYPNIEGRKKLEYLSNESCCSKNCCKSWDREDLIHHAEDLHSLSKNETKIVILTILRNCSFSHQQTRYSEQRLRLRFCFCYEPFGGMCSTAFRWLFDIRIDAFKGLLAYFKTHHMSVVPPIHGNKGEESHKLNTLIKRGVTEKVVEFILEIGKSQGEYSPGRHARKGDLIEDKNPDLLWLPCCFNQTTLFRMYNKQYAEFPIGKTKFFILLKNERQIQNIKIRSPRSDMCDYCELQKRKIAGIKPHDEEKAERLTEELHSHQKSYREERNIYNAEREKSLKDGQKYRDGKIKIEECIEHIGIDYGQSIGAPSTTDQLGGTFYLQMRNFLLFGVCSALENTQHCYTYDEREAGKGSNEVISFLHHFLATRKIQTPNIRIHADNCRGQNKNKYVMWYLIWLAATGRVKHIELKFMIKGHTHFIVDSNIGHIKRELRQSNVFCLKHWEEVIRRSSVTNNAKVVNGNDVYDWKKGLSPYYKDFKGISQFQHFYVDSDEPGYIMTKYGFDDEVWKKTKLLKTDKNITLEKFIKLPEYLDTVGFQGGKPEKEALLYKNLRQYVDDEWKDELCPNPKTFKPPLRTNQSCPDWL